MKRIKLLYNPFSGDKSFKYNLDPCIHILQNSGYEVHPFRSVNQGDFERHLGEINPGLYDGVLVSGGDGSINITINAMLENHLDIPLGIIPSGTANDFAAFLKIPGNLEQALEVICRGNILPVDVGSVNGKYFINVCAAGLWTNISQNIDTDFKNTFGKLAYYIKGIEQLPNFYPMPVRITTSSQVLEEEIYLFMALNSSGTGGFENLIPAASIQDGKLDFIAMKSLPFGDLAKLLMKVLTRDFLDSPGIVYLQDTYFRIESLESKAGRKMTETDTDGEQGPDLPVDIRVHPGKIKLFMP